MGLSYRCLIGVFVLGVLFGLGFTTNFTKSITIQSSKNGKPATLSPRLSPANLRSNGQKTTSIDTKLNSPIFGNQLVHTTTPIIVPPNYETGHINPYKPKNIGTLGSAHDRINNRIDGGNEELNKETIEIEDLKDEISELKGLTIGLANIQTKKLLQLEQHSKKLAYMSEEANAFLSVDQEADDEFIFDQGSEVDKMSDQMLTDTLLSLEVPSAPRSSRPNPLLASGDEEYLELLMMDTMDDSELLLEEAGERLSPYFDSDSNDEVDNYGIDEGDFFDSNLAEPISQARVNYGESMKKWRKRRSTDAVKSKGQIEKNLAARKARALRQAQQKRRLAEKKRRAVAERTRKSMLAKHAKRLRAIKSPCQRKAIHSEFLRKMALQRMGELNRQVRSLTNQLQRLVAIRKREIKLRHIQVQKQARLKRMQQNKLASKRKAQATSLARKQKLIKLAQARIKELRNKRSIERQLKQKRSVIKNTKPKAKVQKGEVVKK